MSGFGLVSDNLDLQRHTRKDYLRLAEGWDDPFGVPTVERVNAHGVPDESGRFMVVREDLLGAGSKSRGADLFVSRMPADHFVYATPRVGYAGISLAMACRRHGKRLTLVIPACAEISSYQYAAAIAGAELRCVKIAAMPNLIAHARTFATRAKAYFIPLGVHHPLITAALVKACAALAKEHGHPGEMWSVIATGVLTRALQIGLPHTEFVAVAVGRTLKPGEWGKAKVLKYPKKFDQRADLLPCFPCVPSYDAKGWEMMVQRRKRRSVLSSWFWNVAGEPMPPLESDLPKIKSQREWNDLSDLDPKKPAIKILPLAGAR